MRLTANRRSIAARIAALLLFILAGAPAAVPRAGEAAPPVPAPAAPVLPSRPRPGASEDAEDRLSRIEQATWDRDARTIPLLREWAATDPSDRVRERSVGALAIIGDPEPGPLLLGRLADDPSAEVRRAAAEAIGLLGPAAAVGRLAVSLRSDADPFVRAECARAIGRTTAVGSAPSQHALLVAVFWDPSPEVRALAAEALAALRSPESAELLRAVAEQDDSTLVRTYAVRALAKTFPLSSAPLFRAVWEQARDPELRVEAFRGLLLAEKGDTWERVGLADGDERVRFLAFREWLSRAMEARSKRRQFPDDDFAASLESFLSDKVRGIRELAREQLESFGVKVRRSGFGYAVER